MATRRAEPTVMPLYARECELRLARRPWTKSERQVVLHGFFGRSLFAIEPIVCFVVFAALTAGLVFFPLSPDARLTRWEASIVIAPVFGFVAGCFLIYAVAVMIAPVRALAQTFSPIFVVDGYVRHRRPDRNSAFDSNGYVAVLNEERQTIAEWPSIGEAAMHDAVRPAMVEFSFFAGIHKIDGKSTGVIPEAYPRPLGGSYAPRR